MKLTIKQKKELVKAIGIGKLPFALHSELYPVSQTDEAGTIPDELINSCLEVFRKHKADCFILTPTDKRNLLKCIQAGAMLDFQMEGNSPLDIKELTPEEKEPLRRLGEDYLKRL